MKLRRSSLATSAVKRSQYPEQILPQIAFFGRSNAGKSSLINTLIERKNLARTSSAPGKTRLLNFYLIDALATDDTPLLWHYVDLPGYGYAKVSKSERAAWLGFIEEYLRYEVPKQCWQLVDIRHKPSEQDIEMNRILLDNGFNVTVIANKADKISKNQRAKSLKEIAAALQMSVKDIVVFSAISREGKEILQEKTEAFVKSWQDVDITE